jgi:hypothetical protein
MLNMQINIGQTGQFEAIFENRKIASYLTAHPSHYGNLSPWSAWFYDLVSGSYSSLQCVVNSSLAYAASTPLAVPLQCR